MISITITSTDAFTTSEMGMDGSIVRRPVALSAVALASYIEYGESLWTEYNYRALHNLADKNGWMLNIYSDEEDFDVDWTRFRNGLNAAVAVIAGAISAIDLGNF